MDLENLDGRIRDWSTRALMAALGNVQKNINICSGLDDSGTVFANIKYDPESLERELADLRFEVQSLRDAGNPLPQYDNFMKRLRQNPNECPMTP